MLDCRMASLSPATPVSILSECYGIWDHENMTSSIVTKLESTDIMDFGEPMPSSTTSLDHNGPIVPNVNIGNDFGGYPSPFYLPTLTSDPYSSDCHLLESFHCPGSMDPSFQKLSDSSMFSETYDHFIPDLLQHQPQSDLHQLPLHQCHGGHDLSGSSYPVISTHQEYNSQMWDNLNPLGGVRGSDFFLRKGTSPSTSESILSYTDVDSEIDSKSSRESLSAFTQGSSRINSPPKRRVGRPPKKDKKLKRAAEKKTGRLWEFIRDLLKNPDYCPSLVRWENPEEGHFRFVNSEKVAQLWGQIKGNPRMTYEKLSRAMRYYYKSHVFEPVLGRRLVYKFGYNATNWRPQNPNFVQKLY